MKLNTWLLLVALFTASFSQAQNINTTFRSKITYPGQTLANVWGYWADGKEYALVGASQGLIIVDITNPDSPQEIVQIPGPNNLWKEIKTYGHYAYVVSEGGMGVQIIDLSPLPSPNLPYHSYYGDGQIAGQFNKAHALHIDETKGYLYLYGSNLNNGTVFYVNLNPDPNNPTYAGHFPGIGYVHDGYVDNDTMYACHIYAGMFSVVNTADKLNPELVATQTTPNAFPHNTWLSTDRKTIFSTDEVSNSFLTAYDISDPTDIKYLDKIQSNPGSNSIVHNTEILGNYAVTSWYKDGFTIVDVTRPSNLVQVGDYDTYNGSGSGFNGCWGVYPYFPSGTIIASNISAPGSNNNGELYIITPEYQRACYLEGTITDAANGQPLQGATITIAGGPDVVEQSDVAGVYKMGRRLGGQVAVYISKPGYQTFGIQLTLEHGQVFTLDAALIPDGNIDIGGLVVRATDGAKVAGAKVVLYGPTQQYTTLSGPDGAFIFNDVPTGIYNLSGAALGNGKKKLYHQTYAADNNGIVLELTKSSN